MSVIPFTYEDSPVRVVELNGEPWFVAGDVCDYFGVTNRNRTMQQLDRDEKGGTQIDTPGGRQVVTVVSESGLYHLLFILQPTKARGVSDEHIAQRVEQLATFRRWITSEVLPAIRKHGGYLTLEATEAALTDPDFIIRLATSLKEERAIRAEAELLAEERRARLALVEPKALAFDRWLSSNVNYSVETVAKAIAASGVPMGRQRLFAYMADLGWIYRGDRSMWTPYQSQLETGRLAVKLAAVTNDRTGELFSTTTVRITPKGARDLAVKLGALPESVAEALDDAA